MHREGKSTHINTRSWKCWLENNKLGGNKSFSELVFFHRGSFIWSGGTWGTLGGSLQGVKTSFQPQRGLEERWKCRGTSQQWRASLKPQSSMNLNCPVSSATQKKSEMGWSKSCSNLDQSQILALVGVHPYPWQAWQLAGNARGGITASCCQQNFHFSLQRETAFLCAVFWGCQEGHEVWDESLWTYLISLPKKQQREPFLSLGEHWKATNQNSEAGRHSDMEGHNNPSQRHSPQGAIVLGTFPQLCNMRKEMEELSQSNSSVVGMLNGCNEGNCSTPAMVGGSHQICRIWPDPSLSPTPRLKEQASFVFWWKIYTVKQIRA